MYKALTILFFFLPGLLVAQVGPGTGDCVSSLSFGDPNSYTAPDCGSINASQWTVTNDSCTMGTAPTTISLGVDSVDVTICGRVNPSGNLESNDKAYLKYTVDGIQVTWDTIPGDRFTKVTELCKEIRVVVGAVISAEVTYVNNHQSEDWRLQDGGIGICYTTPLVLPVELMSFTASLNNGFVDLEWSTASESQNNYFIVERSEDGINFSDLEQVQGSGNSSSIIDYSIVDENPYLGLSYYRLTQVDYDGNFTTHNIVAVNNKESINYGDFVEVIPNPANKETDIEIQLDGFNNQKIFCSLIDAYGVEVYSFVVFSETNNRYVISSNDLTLSSGVYFVRGSTNDALFSKKIVVQ